MDIRRTRSADVDALLSIENTVFATDQMSRRSLVRSVRAPTMTMLTAVVDGRPIGYALVHRRHGSKVAHLASIAVAPEGAGQGIGHSLLRRVESDAAAHGAGCVRLEVRSDNSVARHLYESAGYGVLAVLDDYYEDGTAAVRYEKRIARTTRPYRKRSEGAYLRA